MSDGVPDTTGHPKRAAFLAAIAEWPSVRDAAKKCDMSRSTHYEWLKNPDYERQFKAAYATGCQALEDEALERIREGKSDTMLIFLMKGTFPEKYRERWDGHISGAAGGPIAVEVGSAREQVEAGITRIIARARAETDPGRPE